MKLRRPASQLRAMIQVRLNTQPEVRSHIAADPRLVPIAGPAETHERDARGRTWDIRELVRRESLERRFRDCR